MTLETLLSLGEWAGAIAVVATLFYLAKQIRQQNRVSEFSAWKSMIADFNDFNRLFVDDMEKYDVFMRGLEDPDSLSDREAAHFQQIFRVNYNSMLAMWKAYATGNLPAADWVNVGQSFTSMVRTTEGGKKWRALNEHIFPEFWVEIDRLPVRERYVDQSLGRETI